MQPASDNAANSLAARNRSQRESNTAMPSTDRPLSVFVTFPHVLDRAPHPVRVAVDEQESPVGERQAGVVDPDCAGCVSVGALAAKDGLPPRAAAHGGVKSARQGGTSITRRVMLAAVISSLRDATTERLWSRKRTKGIDPRIERVALRKLTMLDAAELLDDLRVPPGNRLEALKRDWAGQHSIRINQQWRICFVWTAAGPDDAEIVDFH